MEAFFQNATPVGRRVLGNADTTDRPTGAGYRQRSLDGLLEADAFEHGVRAVLGQLADALDRFVAALVDDVGGAELLPEPGPLRVASEQDDPLRAKSLRRDNSAQPDRAVADHGDSPAGTDMCGKGGVMTGTHHVAEREQRRHERIVHPDREHDQRAVCLRDTHRFALGAVDVAPTVPAAMQTLSLQTLPAEDTRSVRPEKRRDHLIADLDGFDVGADRLDDPDELVAHSPAGLIVRHGLVRPQVAATDGGAPDANKRVRGVNQPGIRDILDPDITGFVHDGCAHE